MALSWDWLDSALDFGGRALNTLDTVGNLYNRATSNPLVNAGAGYYFANRANDRNNTAINQAIGGIQSGINQSNQTVRDFRDDTLSTAGQIYGAADTETQPYRSAGSEAIGGYTELLKDPSRILQDPQYQWTFDQGAEAVRRNMAATGYRGSGNEQIELTKYGQGHANTYMNDYLSRFLPVINAGQTATGQYLSAGQNHGNVTAATNYGASREISSNNRSMGETLAAGALGRGNNDSTFDTEFMRILGLGGGSGNPSIGAGNPVAGALSTANDIRNAAGVVGEVGNMATAGGGNPVSAAIESARNMGDGTWADPLAGPRRVARMPSGSPVGAAGTLATGFGSMPAFGTLPTSLVANAGAVTPTLGQTMGFAPQFGAYPASPVGAAATGAGSAAAGTIGLGSALGIAGGVIAIGKLLHNIKGGATESAKAGKYLKEVQRRAAADPTGQGVASFMADLAENRQWPGEGNGWVLGDAIDKGIINTDFPNLHSASSVVDLWRTDPAKTAEEMRDEVATSHSTRFWDPATGRQRPETVAMINAMGMGAKAVAQSYGLNESQQEQYKRLFEGDDKAALNAFVSQHMTPEKRRQYAQGLYQRLRDQGYQGDLSKLESYLRGA